MMRRVMIRDHATCAVQRLFGRNVALSRTAVTSAVTALFSGERTSGSRPSIADFDPEAKSDKSALATAVLYGTGQYASTPRPSLVQFPHSLSLDLDEWPVLAKLPDGCARCVPF
jgi:hypothetical protein